MTGDKLLISCIASDADLRSFSTMLQTLILNPPSIPWDLAVVGVRESSKELAKYCGQCENIKFMEAAGDEGDVVEHMATQETNLRALIHPDILFLNHDWCDIIFSTMLDRGAAMVGALPFQEIIIGEKKVPSISPHFLIWDHSFLARVGGLSGTGLGPWAWQAAYLRARSAGMQCVGAEVKELIHHFRLCGFDSNDTEDVHARAEILEGLVEKEGLQV